MRLQAITGTENLPPGDHKGSQRPSIAPDCCDIILGSLASRTAVNGSSKTVTNRVGLFGVVDCSNSLFTVDYSGSCFRTTGRFGCCVFRQSLSDSIFKSGI